jgi:hypothetical protein
MALAVQALYLLLRTLPAIPRQAVWERVVVDSWDWRQSASPEEFLRSACRQWERFHIGRGKLYDLARRLSVPARRGEDVGW